MVSFINGNDTYDTTNEGSITDTDGDKSGGGGDGDKEEGDASYWCENFGYCPDGDGGEDKDGDGGDDKEWGDKADDGSWSEDNIYDNKEDGGW